MLAWFTSGEESRFSRGFPVVFPWVSGGFPEVPCGEVADVDKWIISGGNYNCAGQES